jgi:hypothetical protein
LLIVFPGFNLTPLNCPAALFQAADFSRIALTSLVSCAIAATQLLRARSSDEVDQVPGRPAWSEDLRDAPLLERAEVAGRTGFVI